MSALIGRHDSGCGLHIDLSQIEASVSMIGEAFVEAQTTPNIPGPRGNVGPNGEKWVLTQVAGDDKWVALSSSISEDHDDSIVVAARPTRKELLEAFRNKGVESAPVLTPDEVTVDKRFKKRGFIQHVSHPHRLVGQIEITSVPWKVDEVVPKVTGAAPLLGNDNYEILGRYLTEEELKTFEQEGALS
jgi:crotonobetainyl-CoA:carnitine CoA-transferase CaiB-like acyl-CoA transferase